MGIVNVTPDSFSDGGAFARADAAVAQAMRLAGEGAAVIDIGGESTRPGFTPISLEEERARVLPVLEALSGRLTVPLSIDTTKPTLAREAMARGVGLVNDIWGLQGDPAMADVVAEGGAKVVVMHNRASMDADLSLADELVRFFERSLALAERAGIARERIVLDPGVGFGKTPRQQIEAVHAIPMLVRRFGLPLLVGLSRKSVLKTLTPAPLPGRLPDTIAANLAALSLGARLFRVHDVAEHVAALQVFARLRGPAGA